MEQKRSSFSKSWLSLLFALISIAVMVILKLLFSFGVFNTVLNGIMCIIYLALPIIGATFAFVENRNIRSFDFLFNLAVLALGIIAFV